MTNIALDSNIWIYLTKDTFIELWNKLREMKENGEIKVIVNDVILKEWTRNKSNTINSLVTSIKNDYVAAINLSNYLQEDVKSEYLKIISEYKDESNRIEKAKQRVEDVELFMKSCTIISTTPEQKLFIAELAINKKPPFQNNKNNFNDVLIFINMCEYAENKIPSLYDLIYVSNNPDDFIDKSTKSVYPDLLNGLEHVRFKNVRELGEALNIAPALIDDFDDWLEVQLDNEAMCQIDLMRRK